MMDGYGFLSLLPPIVAVTVAWKYKNVLVALFAGAYAGTLVVHLNPITALVDLVQNYILAQAADSYNSNLLVMMVFIGGFIGIVTYSGGARAFAELSTRYIGTRSRAQIATWIAGLLVFFSDSCSPLLVGSVFQPICDRMRISREKLAWMLDTTASPVCILVPFIGWGIFIQGLIRKEFDAVGNAASEWSTFISVIPFQFYALLALFMVPLVAAMRVEFGEMHKAEKRTVETGQPYWPGAKITGDTASANMPKGKASYIGIPLVVLFSVFIGVLVPLGFPVKPVPGIMLRTALCSGYFLAAIVCVGLMWFHKTGKPSESFDLYMRGVKEVVFILLILVLAWSLGAVCKTVGTAGYIVGLAKGSLPGWSIPALLFLTGGVISFATGTSWGTFAILIPLAVPAAYSLDAPLLPCIGAVLSGGLFGDHCSPISDTTILSSMGAGCDHLDHVKTQIPYALTVALACLIGYVAVGIYPSRIMLALSAVTLAVLLVVFPKLWGMKFDDTAINNAGGVGK